MGEVIFFDDQKRKEPTEAERAWAEYQSLRQAADELGSKEAHFAAGYALRRFYRAFVGVES